MRKLTTLLTLFFLSLTLILNAQNTYVDKDGKTHLLGKIKADHISKGEFKDWGYEIPEERKLHEDITSKLKDHKVKIFLGTWCGDSKQWVPQFLDLWKNSGLSEDQLEIIALHREDEMYKRSPEEYEKGLNIHRVPSFLFYKEGREVARIVERPINDIKTDITQIALGVPSRARYKAVTMLDELFQTESIDSLYSRDRYRVILRKLNREVTTSSELNTYGYVLKAAGQIEEAEFVFYVNRNLFRNNPNTWDSLAEIYYDQEKYEQAKFNYDKVLEINPESENAKEMLAELKMKMKENGLD